MIYEESPPSPRLATLVRCYWRLTGDPAPADSPPAEPALPDGSPELIFNLGDPFEHVAPDGSITRQPQAFLVGQISGPMVVRPTGPVDLVAVRFESHGAALLHPNLSAITDRWAPVETLAEQRLHHLAAHLILDGDPRRRWALLDSTCAQVVADTPPPDARVAAAVRAIRQSSGAIALDELSRDLGLAPRSLQRLFGRQVGISPKLLARIVRFQRVFGAWREDPRSMARVAAECGYFDQSHLVRDFRDFAGAPPASFLAALPEFTAFFLA